MCEGDAPLHHPSVRLRSHAALPPAPILILQAELQSRCSRINAFKHCSFPFLTFPPLPLTLIVQRALALLPPSFPYPSPTTWHCFQRPPTTTPLPHYLPPPPPLVALLSLHRAARQPSRRSRCRSPALP